MYKLEFIFFFYTNYEIFCLKLSFLKVLKLISKKVIFYLIKQNDMLDKKELQQSEPLRVFLVDLVDKNTNKEELMDRMRELENLVETYGGIVVLQKYQKKDIPDPKTYV